MNLRISPIAVRLVVGLVIVNAFVYVLAGMALLQSLRQQEASAQVTTQNLARSVASTVAGMLDKLDVALAGTSWKITHELSEGGLDERELGAYLRRQKLLLRDFEELWVADAQGRMRWGTNLPAGEALDISDRAYFQAVRQGGDAQLVISQPVIGRVTKGWSIMVARRITRPDGSFGGAVLASLQAVDAFDALVAWMDLGAHGLVALRAEDMTLLARHAPGSTSGPQLGARTLSPEGTKAIARAPASGTYVAPAALDGIERTFSYEKLARYPVYVFVGLDSGELLAAWRSQLATAAGLLLFFTLMTVLYTRANYTRARAQRAAHEAEERAVRIERARLQQILDSAPVGISFTVGGKVQFGNPNAIGIFGGHPGREAQDFYADPAERARIDLELREGKVVTRELRMTDAAGALRDMLVTYVPAVLDNQAGALAWLIDITERKRIEAQIREIGWRNDTALALTRAGYWEAPVDGSGAYTTSPRACEIFGDVPNPQYRYAFADWIANIASVDARIAQQCAATMEDALAGRIEAVEALYPYRRPVDGRVVWIQSRGNVVRDGSGRPVGVYGAAQDITEAIRVQEELARATESAKAATRAKSEFLANMSHEIRTPLNAILGLAHLLRRDAPTPKQARRLQQVDDAGRHLLALVNDVLDLSKIEAGRFQLLEEDFDVADVVREAMAAVSPQAHAKGLRLETHCAGVPPRVRGDAMRLRQALLNYLGNGVKFTREGFVALHASVQEDGGAQPCLRFEVRDSGPGIPADRIGALFRPFAQLEVSAARSHGGTGLGLAITKYLAGMMHGEVGVRSTPGEGSVFWLTVRLQPAGASVAACPAGSPEATAAAVRERHAGARVLLAEDHPIGAEVATDLLQEAGLVVQWARDGTEAVAIAAAGACDLALMDVQMPGMDGLAATRAIRRLPQWADRAIVGLSASAFAEDRQRCLEAGMDDFLSKPVRPDVLYRVLLERLPARPAGIAPAPAPAPRPEPAAAPAPEAAQAAPAWRFAQLETLAGMDPERLAGFRNRADKYLRLFGSLVQQYEQQLPALRECIAAGRIEEAQFLAHTLMGAAALLGADALMHAAAGVERALKAPAPSPLAAEEALGGVAAALAPLQALHAAAPPVSKENAPCST